MQFIRERTRLLFVCSRNQWRSPSAEALFRDHPDVLARSAGTSPKARRRVSEALLEWADEVYVMERKHRRMIEARFGRTRAIHVLDVPDEWEAYDPELMDLLRDRLHSWFDDEAEDTSTD